MDFLQDRRFHPRELRENEEREMNAKVLPPLQFDPLDKQGNLREETEAAMEAAREQAVEYIGGIYPSDIVHTAIEVNYADRIRKAVESLQKFFDSRGATAAYREIFSLHEHTRAEHAAVFFFEKFKDLPSIDLASAICTRDSRNLVTETLDIVGRNFYNEAVIDDTPRVTSYDLQSIDHHMYTIITAKKIIARSHDANFKRRKTYIAKTSGLIDCNLDTIGTIQEALAGNSVTPDVLQPVIESIFVERVSIDDQLNC